MTSKSKKLYFDQAFKFISTSFLENWLQLLNQHIFILFETAFDWSLTLDFKASELVGN